MSHTRLFSVRAYVLQPIHLHMRETKHTKSYGVPKIVQKKKVHLAVEKARKWAEAPQLSALQKLNHIFESNAGKSDEAWKRGKDLQYLSGVIKTHEVVEINYLKPRFVTSTPQKQSFPDILEDANLAPFEFSVDAGPDGDEPPGISVAAYSLNFGKVPTKVVSHDDPQNYIVDQTSPIHNLQSTNSISSCPLNNFLVNKTSRNGSYPNSQTRSPHTVEEVKRLESLQHDNDERQQGQESKLECKGAKFVDKVEEKTWNRNAVWRKNAKVMIKKALIARKRRFQVKSIKLTTRQPFYDRPEDSRSLTEIAILQLLGNSPQHDLEPSSDNVSLPQNELHTQSDTLALEKQVTLYQSYLAACSAGSDNLNILRWRDKVT